MLTGDDLLAELVNRFTRLHGLYQLLASVRILTGDQSFILFARHFAFEFPLVGETATPASFNFAGFAVVVVFGVGELLLVIVQRLSCRNRSAHCHHGAPPSEPRVERVSILGSDFELIDLLVIVFLWPARALLAVAAVQVW